MELKKNYLVATTHNSLASVGSCVESRDTLEILVLL